MLTEAFSHCHGIGPVRLRKLRDAGCHTWHDVLQRPESLPRGIRDGVLTTCRKSVAALAADDIAWLVDSLASRDRWRVLAHYFDSATFFDIETTGLEYDAAITVIVCWHQGQLRSFVEHENLDEFLDVLDDTRLLVSFNGASFDVPRVLSTFHIPQLPCPHLDLRWSCFHHGLGGSLKSIASTIGISRPPDLDAADGALAVALWSEFQASGNSAARELLVRYCCADVLLLLLVAQHVCGTVEHDPGVLWKQLPAVVGDPAVSRLTTFARISETRRSDLSLSAAAASRPAVVDSPVPPPDRRAMVGPLFGTASPNHLRTRRPRGD